LDVLQKGPRSGRRCLEVAVGAFVDVHSQTTISRSCEVLAKQQRLRTQRLRYLVARFLPQEKNLYIPRLKGVALRSRWKTSEAKFSHKPTHTEVGYQKAVWVGLRKVDLASLVDLAWF
jgi:hypothetical protein